MNKFQSEMSSTSSEVDAHSKRHLRRPCTHQGSDSMSSLECALGILYIYLAFTRVNNQNFRTELLLSYLFDFFVQNIYDF